MQKFLLTLGLLGGFLAGVASAHAQRADIYPFDVKVGGQTAVIEGNPQTAVFAKVKTPVAPDAELEVTGEAGMLMVNVFAAKPDGSVDAATAAKIIVVQSGTKAKLDATMDKSKLTPGLYGANIIFGGKTSRVMFTVK